MLSEDFRQLKVTESLNLSSLASKTITGGTPSRKKSSYWNNGTIPWLKTKEIGGLVIAPTEEHITKEGLNNSSAKFVPADSIVVAMYGATAGKSSWLPFETTTNQATYSIVSDYSAYLFVYLKENYNSLLNSATGSAQQNLNKSLLDKFPIAIPAIEELAEFQNRNLPIIQKIVQNEKESDLMANLRDTLLPKFMSGEIMATD